MSSAPDYLVVGAGIFGLTAALALRQRGHRVTVLDPGPLPHPLAASTDVSKVVRMEYGPDDQYLAMAEAAIEGWRRWNEGWGETLYHEVGVMMVTREPMRPGEFEFESYQRVVARGHPSERLDADEIARRFPAWRPGRYVDGYFNPHGGYAESGRVVAALAREAQTAGILLLAGQLVERLALSGQRVAGVITREGDRLAVGHVVMAAGAWTPWLLPELQPVMRATGHPVFHLRPADPDLFTPPQFTVFTADITRTGRYGFPLHPREGIVKIATHGEGLALHPEHDERVVGDAEETALRAFLADTFPTLAAAPLVYTRRCLYCDTLDEHFWIARHPERDGLTVAAGGSGHAFKFGPVLGDLIADAAEGKPNPWLARFAWRRLGGATRGEEASRYHDWKNPG